MYHAHARPRPPLNRWPQHRRPQRPRRAVPVARRTVLLRHPLAPQSWRARRPGAPRGSRSAALLIVAYYLLVESLRYTGNEVQDPLMIEVR
jgi:hypothetical protein